MASESPISFAGLACSAVGALFFALGRSEDARAAHIAAARALGRLDEAVGLDAALPLLVALRGRADAANPKPCELSDGEPAA